MRINKNGETQKAIFVELPSTKHTELSKYSKMKKVSKRAAIMQALDILFGREKSNER
jgi:hypothetical protein